MSNLTTRFQGLFDKLLQKGWAEWAMIILLAMVPLFTHFPFRVNIFLSWEGAYRLYEGQVPYRDFGIPMGYMYWVVPAVFFKIFGPAMITLVKAQVFINIISGFAFRSILKSLGLDRGIRFIALFVYCVSYSFFNFWPWYNHTVIVYEFVTLAFLFRYLGTPGTGWRSWLNLIGAALFTGITFMTKQDVGGMTLLLGLFFLAYGWWLDRRFKPVLVYLIATAFFLFLFIFPFLSYSFGYWFNHGQPPHTARFSMGDIIGDFFNHSQWIKFYLLLILLFLLGKRTKWLAFLKDRKNGLFFFLVIAILGEAVVIQVTSYTPPDNNIFFHSFAIAYLLFLAAEVFDIRFSQLRYFFPALLGVALWWSGVFWKYLDRFTARSAGKEETTQAVSGENLVNRNTFMIIKDSSIPEAQWVFSDIPVFKGIYMPAPTVEGIKRIQSMPVWKEKGSEVNVLNMTELTPLAEAIPFKLERSPNYPLWYHLGVSMFNREAEMFEKRIGQKEYDVVFFEYIKGLNNFYPFRVRDSLQAHYHKIDSFYAPRRGMETMGIIEIYTK